MASEEAIRGARPITLASAGFTSCSHPIRECYSVPHASHAPWVPVVSRPSVLLCPTASYCLTCGFSLSSADVSRRVANVHEFVNYVGIDRHKRLAVFDFFIRQARTLGPVFGG